MPTVDVTMRVQEGKQYFINRITFVGNTTTRDNVIRREIRLFEGGVFNTEALKFSIKRLNQLGYFKQLEGGKDLSVDKTPGVDNKVDVKLKLEEQNRNQLTFGAGVSQYEGFFGQMMFQTSNFMGRGETLSLSARRVAGEELPDGVHRAVPVRPADHGRRRHPPDADPLPLRLHAERHRRRALVRLPGPVVLAPSRTYSYESIQSPTSTRTTSASDDSRRRSLRVAAGSIERPSRPHRNPFFDDLLLLGSEGRRTISKIVPSFSHNTVDNPIFPSAGKRLTASIDLAGLGGDTAFIKPVLEGVVLPPPDPAAVARRARPVAVRPADGRTRRSCRSSSACSWAASTACAGSTSAASARATRLRAGDRRQPEPAVQRRVPDSDCGAGAARVLLRRGSGAASSSRTRRSTSSRRRRAPKSGSSCRC